MNSEYLFYTGFILLVIMLIISYWETISLITKSRKNQIRSEPEELSVKSIRKSRRKAIALDKAIRKTMGIKSEPIKADELYKRIANEGVNKANALRFAVISLIRLEMKDIADKEIDYEAYELLLKRINNTDFSTDNIEEQIALLYKELEDLKKVKK